MNININAEFQPIETHPLDDEDYLLAIFRDDGELWDIDIGGWVPGDYQEGWKEVEDGVKVKIWVEYRDGRWWSNNDAMDASTHWAPFRTNTDADPILQDRKFTSSQFSFRYHCSGEERQTGRKRYFSTNDRFAAAEWCIESCHPTKGGLVGAKLVDDETDEVSLFGSWLS